MRFPRGWRLNGGLLAALGLAAAVRWGYPTGVLALEGLSAAKKASDLAGFLRPWLERPASPGLLAVAFREFGAGHGTLQFFRSLPAALGYALFGANDVTSFAAPFMVSLLGVLGMYALGARLGGRNAGVLAALVWGLTPAEVFYATTFGPHAVVSLAGILLVHGVLSLRGRPRAVGALLAAGVLVLTGLTLKAHTAQSLYDRALELMGLQEWLVLLPAWFACVLAKGDDDRLPSGVLAACWGVFAAGVLVWGGVNSGAPLMESPLIGLVFIIPVVWVSCELSNVLEKRTGRLVSAGALVLGLFAWLALGPRPLAVPDYGTTEWLLSGDFAMALNLLRGAAAVLTFAYLALSRRNEGAWRPAVSAGLALGLCAASLAIVAERGRPWRGQVERWREAVRWVENQGGGELYTARGFDRLLLEYASGFAIAAGRIGDLGDTWEAALPGWALVTDEQEFGQATPHEWVRLASFGYLESARLNAYQVGASATTCEDSLRNVAPKQDEGVGFQVISPTSICGEYLQGENLLKGAFRRGNVFVGSYLVLQQWETDIWSLRHKYFLFPDGRTLTIERSLDPGAYYLYSIRLSAEEPATALYFRLGGEEFAYGLVHPRDWESFYVMIATPEWWAEPQEATFSPVLINNYGRVLIQDYSLYLLSPP